MLLGLSPQSTPESVLAYVTRLRRGGDYSGSARHRSGEVVLRHYKDATRGLSERDCCPRASFRVKQI
eukprot:14495528-Alexandrium_andersonii.AAC.1